MSLIKANAVQIGQSPTATQNFTLAVPSSPDGTIKLARGNSGATTQDVLSVDASGNVNGLIKSTGSTTARSLANRFADVVNVKDFGAIGDGTVHPLSEFYPTLAAAQAVYGAIVTSLTDTVDWAAIQKAIYYVAAESGGKVFIPDGNYMMSKQVEIFSTGAPGWSSGHSNITFEGCGFNTVLNFSPSAAGQNGISCRYWGGRIEVSRIVVLNSKNVGIEINQDSGPSTWQSKLNFHDIVIQGSASHGMRLRNTYVGSFSDIESKSNGGDGFHLGGFHTSLTFTRCWAGGDGTAGGNQGRGWYINNIIYSSFISCASDHNKFQGYRIQNANGVGFINCGAEANGSNGFFALNVADAVRPSASVPDIRAITFDGCFAVGNGYDSSTNTHDPLIANLLLVEAWDDLSIQVSTRGCYSKNIDPSYRAVEFASRTPNGRVVIHECLNAYNGGQRVQTGNVVPIIFENNNDGNYSGNVGIGKIPTNFGLNWSTVHNYGSEGGVFRSESSSAILDTYATSGGGGKGIIRTVGSYPISLLVNGIEEVNIGTTGQTTIFTDISLQTVTTATSATAGTNGDVPAQVAGYLQVSINGTSRKIPFYAI